MSKKITFTLTLSGNNYNEGEKTEFSTTIPDDVVALAFYSVLNKEFTKFNDSIRAKVNELDQATVNLVEKLIKKD